MNMKGQWSRLILPPVDRVSSGEMLPGNRYPNIRPDHVVDLDAHLQSRVSYAVNPDWTDTDGKVYTRAVFWT